MLVREATVVCADALEPNAAKLKSDWGVAAVVDLTNALCQITGRRIPLVRESQAESIPGPVIRVEIASEGLPAGSQVFRLRGEPGRFSIVARTGMGVSYGVTEFLQRFCDHWFVAFIGGDPVVRNPDLALPVFDRTFAPAIRVRSVYHGMYDHGLSGPAKQRWVDWSRRLRLEACASELESEDLVSCQVGNCHTTFKYCPPEKYFKDHPEYYSMAPGGRRQFAPMGQLCYSNEEVFDIVYDSLVRFIEADRRKFGARAPRIYDFSQQDDTPWICTCEACRARSAQYEGDSGLVMDFVNRLARRIAAKYPDVVIRMFAYVSTDTPPKGIVPEKNVLVWYCDLYSKSDHELPLTHPFNSEREGKLRAWAKVAPRLELWDYMLYTGEFPEISADAIAADARLFREIGLGRLTQETEYRQQPFFEINAFLMGQFYFDPDADLERLLDVACRIYGKGAPKMREAIDFLRRIERAEIPAEMSSWHVRVLPWRRAPNLEKFESLVRAALAAEAPDSVFGWRIRKVLVSVYRELARLYRMDGRPDLRTVALERWREHAVKYAQYGVADPGRRADVEKRVLAEIETETLWFADAPEEILRTNPSEICCIDAAKTERGAGTERVADPDSTRPKALVWRPGKGQQLSQIRCGVYDRKTKETTLSRQIVPPPAYLDEKYHWIHLGKARVGPETILWLPYDWSGAFHLWDYFRFCDGAKEDLNWYDVWISCKFQGPAYVKGSVRPNGFYYDRLILKNIPASDGANIPPPGEPGKREPVSCWPFPDRVSAAVWRNWGLIPARRLADVLAADEETIRRMAGDLGLPADPAVRGDWAERGYITIFRRNWHLLDSEQIRRLLGWSRTKYREMLRGYLVDRLGKEKPKCGPAWYDPAGETTNAPVRRAIGRILAAEGVDAAVTGEPRFAFIDSYLEKEAGKPIAGAASSGAAGGFGLKMIYSYFGRGKDPLSTESMSYSYPEALLADYARRGVNAIWMHPDLRDCSDPERLRNLNTLVARARKFGLKVFLYLNEPFPAECTSEPGTLERLEERMEALFRAVPGLGGFFNITASERKTNCAWCGPQIQKHCPKCANRPQREIICEVCRAMYNGMKRGNPDGIGIAWTWGWPDKDVSAIVAGLPPGMQVLTVSEEGNEVERGGLRFRTVDYVISVPEPSARTRNVIDAAKASGRKILAKVPVNVTWELACVPYLPTVELAAEHAVKLATLGADGLLLSFTLGGSPSPQLELYRDLRPGDTVDAVLDRLARMTYGPAAVTDVRRAWHCFGDGFRNYPSQVKNLYWGPQQMGPANPLYPEATHRRSTMVCYPWDDLEHWHWLFSVENWLALMDKVSSGFAEGNAAWKDVVAKASGKGRALAVREAGVFKAAELHFRSMADQARFIQARDRGNHAEMRRFASRELVTAKEMLSLDLADSRLGFESSNQYYYIPQDLREKIVGCRMILDGLQLQQKEN